MKRREGPSIFPQMENLLVLGSEMVLLEFTMLKVGNIWLRRSQGRNGYQTLSSLLMDNT